MSSIITPTLPTYSTASSPFIAATAYANNTVGTTQTLDLRTSKGAILEVRIGRTGSTALTNPARLEIRPQTSNAGTNNVQTGNPQNMKDCISLTAAATATPVAVGGSTQGSATMNVTSSASFAQGDLCLAQYNSTSTRAEFFTVAQATGNVLTISRSGGFLLAHTAGDAVINGVDVWTVFLGPGEVWEITPVNYSGQTVVMAVDYVQFVSDTVTP